MEIIIRILQVLLCLSILVVTHEGGHFFFAKLFKTKVEKFYLFFDPWFSIFHFKIGETEYGLGWVPFGGYVKIAGMIDESMDTDQMKQPEQPWEFRAKPAWQRLLIMLGGVIVNFITAPILFWAILYTWGETYVPINESKYGLDFHEVMHEVGFKDGDMIVGVNGDYNVDTYKQIANPILYEDTCVINIIRDNEEMSIKMPHEFFRRVLSENVSRLLAVRIPTVIDSVYLDQGAAQAGLMKGDSVIGLAGKSLFSLNEFVSEMANHKDTTIEIAFFRNGVADTIPVHVGADSKIGVTLCSPTRWIELKHIDYGFFAACPAGIAKGYELLCNYVKQLPMLFTKEGATKVGGFGTIGKMFPSVWDWESFWFNTAFLAIMLAVMNILPIPALDGGHVLFLLIEIITRRKPSEKVMEYAQTIGMIILLALMLYANGGDIVRAIFD